MEAIGVGISSRLCFTYSKYTDQFIANVLDPNILAQKTSDVGRHKMEPQWVEPPHHLKNYLGILRITSLNTFLNGVLPAKMPCSVEQTVISRMKVARSAGSRSSLRLCLRYMATLRPMFCSTRLARVPLSVNSRSSSSGWDHVRVV